MKPRILVIRGGAIGDFILTLPAIRLLRENFPATQVEILGYEHIIALAHRRYYAEAIKSIEYGPMAGFFIPNSVLAPDLAEYFAGFQQVISYLFDPDGFFAGNLQRAGVKNLLPAYVKIDGTQHAARQLAQPLERLALFLDDPAAMIHPSPEDFSYAREFLGASEQPIIALHPGSGSPRKNWPLDHWRQLGSWLTSLEPPPRLLIVGGEADDAQLTELPKAWPHAEVLVARGVPLPALGAILTRCELFIGHDSGISHLAAAVGTNCLLLFGPTDPAVWAPANPGVTVLQSPGGLLGELSVEEVKEAILTRWTQSA